jgi:hypothetical protein
MLRCVGCSSFAWLELEDGTFYHGSTNPARLRGLKQRELEQINDISIDEKILANVSANQNGRRTKNTR